MGGREGVRKTVSEGGRELTERERDSFILWFTFQMPATFLGLAESRIPEISSGVPHGWHGLTT